MHDTRDLFERHSLRCTRQRMEVYEALRDSRAHPTVEELYRLVLPRLGKVSRATVYNAIDALCRVGLVRRMPTNNGSCRFDADLSPHVHLRYRDTSEIIDLPGELEPGDGILRHLPREMIRRLEESLDVSVDGVSVQLLVSRRKPGAATPPGEASRDRTSPPGDGDPPRSGTS